MRRIACVALWWCWRIRVAYRASLRSHRCTAAGLLCVLQVLGTDMKAEDLEVGVVSKANPDFRQLTEQEIEAHLTAIAEQD